MSWDQLLEPGVVVRESPVETERFGCSIERVTIGPGPVDEDRLLALVEDLSADVLVVRYDAARLELPATFAGSRRAVVPAGTLTYWEKPVSVAEPPEPSHIKVLSAEAMNLETVSTLVRNMVRESFRAMGTTTRRIRSWTVPRHWPGTRTGQSAHSAATRATSL